MAASDYATLLTALGPKSASGFIQALEERGVYVIDSMEDPTDLNAGNILSLLFNGVLFWYDPADSTTVHDGVTCIVTAEGRRYKSDQYSGVSSRWIAVKDKDLTAPPGSPALQDTYIVAAGGTGAWAAKDKKFATWTARGWVFLTPKAFDYAYVIDEALIYHYSAGGVWTSGIPAITIANSSISQNKLRYFKLGIAVENQTTNAPPGSPAAGVAYIVGGAPSGVWVGHSLDLAIFEDGAWLFYDPYEGAHLYDRNLNATIVFNGATWVAGVSGYSQVAISTLDASASVTGTYVFSTTAPTTSNMSLIHSLSFTAKKAGALVEVTVNYANIVMVLTGPATDADSSLLTCFGIFLDSVANGVDWGSGPRAYLSGPNFGIDDSDQGFSQTFLITISDTSAHDIKLYGSKSIIIHDGSNPPTNSVTTENVRIFLREIS